MAQNRGLWGALGDPRGWCAITTSLVGRDAHGFLLTGSAAGAAGAAPFATSLAGVFAIGDVRAGSVKRVGGAIERSGLLPVVFVPMLSGVSPS